MTDRHGWSQVVKGLGPRHIKVDKSEWEQVDSDLKEDIEALDVGNGQVDISRREAGNDR